MVNTVEERFHRIGWSVTDTGCWEWRGSRHKHGGYGQLMGSEGRPLKTHRLAYELFVGPIPAGELIRHTCDNPPCVNPAHLLTGTDADNSADMIGRGRGKHTVMSGEHCPASKLDWAKVQEIRSSDESGPVLAKRYGVSRVTISKVKRGLVWKTQGSKRVRTIR